MQEVVREATVDEQKIFAKLLSVSFPGRDDLQKMLVSALVSPIDELGSLKIICQHSLPAPTVKQIPVEGEISDVDGVSIRVLLHVRDGRPSELEIYKDDGSVIKKTIDPDELGVVVMPPHP